MSFSKPWWPSNFKPIAFSTTTHSWVTILQITDTTIPSQIHFSVIRVLCNSSFYLYYFLLTARKKHTTCTYIWNQLFRYFSYIFVIFHKCALNCDKISSFFSNVARLLEYFSILKFLQYRTILNFCIEATKISEIFMILWNYVFAKLANFCIANGIACKNWQIICNIFNIFMLASSFKLEKPQRHA